MTINNTSNDNFERIAQDAVSELIATAFTLRAMGEDDLSLAIAEQAGALCLRAIALS